MKNQAPRIKDSRKDMQAILRSGFNSLTHSSYWLLTIKDAAQARSWLQAVRPLVKSASEVGSDDGGKPAEASRAVTLAFSYTGLQTLGIAEDPAFPFPTPFKAGMGSPQREALLRDAGQVEWSWGDVCRDFTSRQVVHILVAHFWHHGAEPAWPEEEVFAAAFDSRAIHGDSGFFQPDGTTQEAFGFRDGLSQPIVPGLRDRPEQLEANSLQKDHVVEPGEFVLGHVNEYREITYCPDVRDWHAKDDNDVAVRFGQNGSYLAVRQIHQYVDAFNKLTNVPAPPAPGCPFDKLTVAEKLMGRRKGAPGTPLAWHPDRPTDPNAFRYRVDDLNGLQCPRGAHIRRANPRDTLGHDVKSGVAASKLHRLLRRGRSYRQGNDQGIFFIACNADLDRQFEFVLQRWLGNPHFGDMREETDPLLNGWPKPTPTFAIPGLPIGKSLTLAQFTRTLGGGYFFLPGIKALQFIAAEGPECEKPSNL